MTTFRPAYFRRWARAALRPSRRHPGLLPHLRPVIFDPLGARVTRRTLTGGGVVSGKRRR